MKAQLFCLLVVGLSFFVTEAHTIRENEEEHNGLGDVKADGFSIDDLIVNATEDANEFNFYYSPESFDPNQTLIKVEYDMVLTVAEWEERNSQSDRKRAAAIKGYRWTNHHIPYQLASGVFTSKERKEIMAGMSDWSKYTCLTFSKATKGNRMYFNNAGGCHSRVGMVGGAQTVGLAKNCRYKQVVLHEVGHAIGLKHEQTRPDRDRYVKIFPKNISDKQKHNFKKLSLTKFQELGIPYDYLSIMHYGPTAFSSNNGITIQTIDPRYQNIIGKRHRLSFRDIKTVNLMYKCRQAKKCKRKDSDCPGEGFVGKDCKCWCPGDPYVLCKTKQKTGGTTASCYDRNTQCNYWARTNQCSAFAAYMKINCRKSCKLCVGKPCVDKNKNCQYWAKNNECSKNPGYMLANCKKSCNVKNC